jgi:hypothetical protein
LLAAAHGQSDGKLAKQIFGLELTERASSLRLARWEADFPGRHCHEVFTGLADASAFLDLPAADLPAFPPPEMAEQQIMISRAVNYLKSAVSRLPNFFATRKTEHFEDTPVRQTVERLNPAPFGRGSRSGGLSSAAPGQTDYVPLHNSGRSSVMVSYRDGYELVNSKPSDFRVRGSSASGLTTGGEFGPILWVVLDDAIKGKIMWGHWEQGATGIEAVFRYSVPAGQSSYLVAIPEAGHVSQVYPAYHGEIAIDPTTANILRITVIGDFVPPYEQVGTSIAVEYGPVLIGGTTYICPIKGVAISRMPPMDTGKQEFTSPAQIQMQLNDIAFTDYHLFRAESRLITSVAPESPQSPAPPK